MPDIWALKSLVPNPNPANQIQFGSGFARLLLTFFCSGQVISGLYPGVTTVELDNLAAEIAATMTTYHPDYATLAARYVPPTGVPVTC
jgi:hypothetical protein